MVKNIHNHILLLFFILLHTYTYSQETAPQDSSIKDSQKQILRNSNSFLVDDFENVGEWIIKYSQFRSFNWDVNNQQYQNSNEWIKWINASDYPDLSIFPYKISNKLEEANQFNKENKILGIRARWEKLNYNWFAIEPSAIRYAKEISKNKIAVLSDPKTKKPRYHTWDEYAPNFIWIPTVVDALSIYVWSGGYEFYLEAHFQDMLGQNYVVPVADLNYHGWKNLKITLPKKLIKQQNNHTLPENQNLKFVRFVVHSKNKVYPAYHTGYEHLVNPIHIYMDHFYAHIQDLESFFYGYDLQFFNQFWEDQKEPIQNENQKKSNTN